MLQKRNRVEWVNFNIIVKNRKHFLYLRVLNIYLYIIPIIKKYILFKVNKQPTYSVHKRKQFFCVIREKKIECK